MGQSPMVTEPACYGGRSAMVLDAAAAVPLVPRLIAP